MEAKRQFSFSSMFVRYFLHGLAFSLLFLVLGIIWLVIFVVLVEIGAVIGFIIGLIVLFFFIGGLNSFLTGLIWSVTMKTNWKSLLVHGFSLFIVLLIAGLPSYFLGSFSHDLTFYTAIFLIYSFIDGAIAKNVGFWWKEEPLDSVSEKGEVPTETNVQELNDSSKSALAETEKLYNELTSKYIHRWGAQTGVQLLHDELNAYLWQGDSYADAVRKIHQRQQPETAN